MLSFLRKSLLPATVDIYTIIDWIVGTWWPEHGGLIASLKLGIAGYITIILVSTIILIWINWLWIYRLSAKGKFAALYPEIKRCEEIAKDIKYRDPKRDKGELISEVAELILELTSLRIKVPKNSSDQDRLFSDWCKFLWFLAPYAKKGELNLARIHSDMKEAKNAQDTDS